MDSAVDDNNSSSGSRSSSDGDDESVQPPLPVFEEDAKPKTTEIVTRCYTTRKSRKTIWESDYFYIPEAARDGTRMRIHMRNSAMSSGLGNQGQSKQMTPTHFGETIESCPVTILLLRAWSICRVHGGAWASAKTCRQRSIDEELSLLKRDVQKVLTEKGGSLGDKKADSMWAGFKNECPELGQ